MTQLEKIKSWCIKPTRGGALGNKFSIKSGDLWLGHLYMDDISHGVDSDDILNLIAAAPELLKDLEHCIEIIEQTTSNTEFLNPMRETVAKAKSE